MIISDEIIKDGESVDYFLPESHRAIDNNRKLIFQMPWNNVSENCLISIFCRINKNITIECKKSQPNSRQIGNLFKGMAEIVDVEEYKKIYKYYPKRLNYAFISVCGCDMLGLETDNHIPYILLEDDEINWALDFIKQYEKPVILINGTSSGYKTGNLRNILPINSWAELTERLSNNYTLLSLGLSKNYYPIPNTIPLLDLALRQECALARACGKTIGSDNSKCHLFLAAGAFCFTFVPSLFGCVDGWLSSAFLRTDDMWKYECKREIYIEFWNYRDIFKYF
jgi:hypothetical protein